MLIELRYLKSRLNISGSADDVELTRIAEAVGASFDKFCDRHSERSESAEQWFWASEREIPLLWYPVESVSSIMVRTSARAAWVRQSVDYEIISNCILSLRSTIGDDTEQARVLYSGGYVVPGTTAEVYQTALPKDLEQAALDQAAGWYENRHTVRIPSASQKATGSRGAADLTLMPHVVDILNTYRRMSL